MKRLIFIIIASMLILTGCGTEIKLENYTLLRTEAVKNWTGIDSGYFKSPSGETFKFYLPEHIERMMLTGQNYDITYIMNGMQEPDYEITKFKPTNLK